MPTSTKRRSPWLLTLGIGLLGTLAWAGPAPLPLALLGTGNECQNAGLQPFGTYDQFYGSDNIVHQVLCWNSATQTVSVLSGGSLIIPGSGAVTSVFGRTGAVIAVKTDYSAVVNLQLGDGTNSIVFNATPTNGILIQDSGGNDFVRLGGTSVTLGNFTQGGTLTLSNTVGWSLIDSFAGVNQCTAGVCIIGATTGTFNGAWNFTTPPTGIGAASSVLFTNVTSGTNTTAAMICGTGCSLSVSGAGTINATSVNGLNIPSPASAGLVLNATAANTVAWTPTPTYGGVGIGTGSATYSGNTSGSVTVGCTAANCTQFGAGAVVAVFKTYNTATNCSSSASPAVCGSASAGGVAVPTGTNPTLQINTSGVTAASHIFLQIDESLGGLGTCNTTLSTLVQPVVTARAAGTSFTIQIGAVIATNPVCVSYWFTD